MVSAIGGSRHVGRARGPASDAEEGVDGLILGTLACLLFKLSPLMAILSAVSRWYCGRALFVGSAQTPQWFTAPPSAWLSL